MRILALACIASLAMAVPAVAGPAVTTDVLGRTVCAESGALTKWDANGNVVACVIRASADRESRDLDKKCVTNDKGCKSCRRD
jgi:hypothetical protein